MCLYIFTGRSASKKVLSLKLFVVLCAVFFLKNPLYRLFFRRHGLPKDTKTFVFSPFRSILPLFYCGIELLLGWKQYTQRKNCFGEWFRIILYSEGEKGVLRLKKNPKPLAWGKARNFFFLNGLGLCNALGCTGACLHLQEEIKRIADRSYRLAVDSTKKITQPYCVYLFFHTQGNTWTTLLKSPLISRCNWLATEFLIHPGQTSGTGWVKPIHLTYNIISPV